MLLWWWCAEEEWVVVGLRRHLVGLRSTVVEEVGATGQSVGRLRLNSRLERVATSPLQATLVRWVSTVIGNRVRHAVALTVDVAALADVATVVALRRTACRVGSGSIWWRRPGSPVYCCGGGAWREWVADLDPSCVSWPQLPREASSRS